MIHVVAIITAKPGMREAILREFRANMPAEWRKEYQAGLETAQRFAEERSHKIRAVVWRGLES